MEQRDQQGHSSSQQGSALLDSAASVDDASDMPRIQKRPRRTHARRSCQMCQQRKARCELPDLHVPSSPIPLPDHQACHRCKTLQISCIVDDSNKKKAKTAAPNDKSKAPPATRRRSGPVPSTPSIGSRAGRMSISSSSSSAGMVPSSAQSFNADDRTLAGGRVLGDQIVYPSEARLVSKTPTSSDDEGTPPPSSTTLDQSRGYIKTQERNPRDAADIDTWERFSTRSRPLTLLTELVPRQNGFASKIFRLVSARATIETDVRELVSNEKSKILSDWCEENLTLWLPHVSNAYQIRQDALQGRQTLSTQLLEQVLYLIALQHLRDPADDVLRFSIARFIIRDTARLMLTSPRSAKAVEALELLALFPLDVSCISGPSRNRIRTDALINSAERFARSVRLDRMACTAAAPYSFFSSANQQLDDFDTKRTRMAWASVKTWYTCFTIGDDELYESVDERFFSDGWSRALSLPEESNPEENDLSRVIRPSSVPDCTENDLFAKKRWSRARRIGSIGLSMRVLAMRQLLVAFHAIRTTPVDLPEAKRLYKISDILDDYRKLVEDINYEFRQRLPDDASDSRLLRTWLSTETTAGYLLVLGAGIFRGLGIDRKENVPSHELALLIRGENASDAMREFLTRYGEHRILAAEKVLVNISIICRDGKAGKAPQPSNGTDPMGQDAGPQSKGWMVAKQSRTVVPILNLCGYALEAAFNAMELHATMFKLWKAPPKRSDSWQLVFSNVISALLSLDPNGSIQSGSIPATCAYILQGMLKVIVTWTDCSRKKEHQRTTSSSDPDTFRRDERSNVRNSRPSQPPPRATAPGGPPDLSRYAAFLPDDLTLRRSLDSTQDFAGPAPRNGIGSTGDDMRRASSGASANSYSVTASLFESNIAAAPRYSDVRNAQAGPSFAPSSTESLAAALPGPAGGYGETSHACFPPALNHQPPPPQQQQTGYMNGPSQYQHQAMPQSTMAAGSSVSSNSSNTQTPPNSTFSFPEPIRGGVPPNGIAGVNGAGQQQEQPGVALESLDFILNDVLGSSEWSGILHDIWGTDM